MDFWRFPESPLKRMSYITLLTALTIVDVSIVCGIKTCDHPTIVSFYRDACKLHKRSHHNALSPFTKSSSDSEIDEEEVSQSFSDALTILHEFMDKSIPPPKLRTKKQTMISISDNEIPSELFEGLDFFPVEFKPIIPIIPIRPYQAVKYWKKLMRSAIVDGGKVRRDAYSAVHKCCSPAGCSHSDFVHFC